MNNENIKLSKKAKRGRERKASMNRKFFKIRIRKQRRKRILMKPGI